MKPPVFLIGSQRSGTTMLRLILTRSTEMHIPRETEKIPALEANSREYGSFSTPAERWYFIRDLQRTNATSRTTVFDAFQLDAAAMESALLAAAPTDYAGACAAIYAASARAHGKVRWGDKSPGYVMHVSWLATSFPAARFIHIVRDPRDVAVSIRRAGWSQTCHSAGVLWRRRVLSARDQGRPLGPSRYREIRYEDLVADPAAQVGRLCEWIDLPFDESMLDVEQATQAVDERNADLHRSLHRPINADRVNAWQRELSRRDVADIEMETLGLMKEYGYVPTGARPALSRVAGRAAIRAASPFIERGRQLARKLR